MLHRAGMRRAVLALLVTLPAVALAVGTWGGGDPPSDLEGGMSSLLLIAAAVAGLVALSAVPRLAFSLTAVLLAGAVAGNVAGGAVGWSVAAVVAVALYRAQR
ncbi:MAG TPA: hypothetical protein PKE37_16405 [Thiomonas arsenitoxydans]|uniref:hypothetical protein n=1 Tax=Thiomonas arsenitoxydans (strain DSM 22701 / CIP 110005 / 3As) TaxID=426114 RepID=UPI002B570AA7|nr:hypothetical protein [Thiomonas arsenitoxydans]HML83337.1 hypothetical protein [Thiomonas arsenitoxydans]